MCMLEAVANNIIISINALMDYDSLGNHVKIKSAMLPGEYAMENNDQTITHSYYLLKSKIALSERLPKSCPVTVTTD